MLQLASMQSAQHPVAAEFKYGLQRRWQVWCLLLVGDILMFDQKCLRVESAKLHLGLHLLISLDGIPTNFFGSLQFKLQFDGSASQAAQGTCRTCLSCCTQSRLSLMPELRSSTDSSHLRSRLHSLGSTPPGFLAAKSLKLKTMRTTKHCLTLPRRG